MPTNSNTENYYEQFLEKLIDSQPWPGPYLYKFIVKKESPYLDSIKSFFSEEKSTWTEKHSAKGSYRSLTILASDQTPESVVAIYKQVNEFKGVIIL